jgi:hypothetical protein
LNQHTHTYTQPFYFHEHFEDHHNRVMSSVKRNSSEYQEKTFDVASGKAIRHYGKILNPV